MFIIKERTLQDRLKRHRLLSEIILAPIVALILAYFYSQVAAAYASFVSKETTTTTVPECHLVPYKTVISKSPDSLSDKSITQLYDCEEV